MIRHAHDWYLAPNVDIDGENLTGIESEGRQPWATVCKWVASLSMLWVAEAQLVEIESMTASWSANVISCGADYAVDENA